MNLNEIRATHPAFQRDIYTNQILSHFGIVLKDILNTKSHIKQACTNKEGINRYI